MSIDYTDTVDGYNRSILEDWTSDEDEDASLPTAPWLPLSNRADRDIRRESVQRARLTSKGGQRLRKDVLIEEDDGTISPVMWDVARLRWQHWYDDSRDTKTVVENEDGEQVGFRQPNRFTPEYRERLYARAQGLERGLRERWGNLLHTTMITLTGSSTRSDGSWRCPVDHLEELLSSWEAVRRALSRVLEGRDWEYLTVIEPHQSGYAHVHIGVFTKGPVVEEQFEDVVDAHLRNCEIAEEPAHRICPDDPDDDGCVDVRRVGIRGRSSGEIENLGAYLASYVAGDYESEATEQDESVQRFYSLMWATGRQWFRPSNGAQEFMQTDLDEDDDEWSGEWSLVGIAPDGDLDDVIEVDPEEARGSVYSETRIPDTPPPD